jgi:hypothetical protein
MRRRHWWDDPRFLLRLNRGLKWLWIAMMPVVVIVKPLQHSITLVLLLSLYANMAANWASERALEAQLEEQDDRDP